MNYSVQISESALDKFKDLDEETKQRIRKAFKELGNNPWKSRTGADIKKLIGSSNPTLYRLRVSDYRIIYFIEHKHVRITTIMHRSKGYRWLE